MDMSNERVPHPIDKVIAEEAGHMAFIGTLRWAFALYGEMARAGGGYVSNIATEELVAAAWRVFDGMAGVELDVIPIAHALNGGEP